MNGFDTPMLASAGFAILLAILVIIALIRRARTQSTLDAALRQASSQPANTASAPDTSTIPPPPPYSVWRLVSRNIANPDSAGGPLYRLRIEPEGELPAWQAGAVARIYCGPARDALGRSRKARCPEGDYLIGSLPDDGAVDLVIRLRHGNDDSRSHWLCEELSIGEQVALALRDDPGFGPPPDALPLILIGNATGLAGLHAHIRARPPGTRNWLIFGDRNSAEDDVLAAEIAEWVSTGHLERCDLVFPGEGAKQRRVVNQMDDAGEALLDWALAGAVIYVCGSTPMGDDVHAKLSRLLGADVLEAMAEAGLYRRSLHAAPASGERNAKPA